MKRIPKEISEINTSFTLHEMHVACRILVHHHSFHVFQPPYLHKMVCFLNSWKQIVKTFVLGCLNFRLEETTGLIYALERDISK